MFVGGLNLRKLILNYQLKHALELFTHLTNGWWHQVSQLVIKRGQHVDSIGHWNGLDEVLGVRLGQLIKRWLTIVVYSLVLLGHLLQLGNGLIVSLIEVGFVSTTECVNEGFGVIEFGYCHSEHGDTLATFLCFIFYECDLAISKLKVCHSMVVLGVITQNIGEVAIVVSSQVGVDLVGLECLLEVDTDLSANLGQGYGLHLVISCLAEEKILSLSKAQHRAHSQTFLGEVRSGLTSGQLGNLSQEVLIDPSRLLEVG